MEEFELAAKGTGLTAIVRHLNENSIPTPIQYARAKGLTGNYDDGNGSWNTRSVKYILTHRGYGIGYSFGMKTGTSKTAKGNPDTYFLTENGKYVFVMYTTQKDDFIKKALEDLEKCFDSGKTGLPAEDVAEVVYCHTCGRLLPGDSQLLHKFCEDRNTVLTLIGLDELGSDLYFNYEPLCLRVVAYAVCRHLSGPQGTSAGSGRRE